MSPKCWAPMGCVSPGISLKPSNSHGGGSCHTPPSPKMKQIHEGPGLSPGLQQAGNEPGLSDTVPMLGIGQGGANCAYMWAAPPSEEDVVCTGLASMAQHGPTRPRTPPGSSCSLEKVHAHGQTAPGPGLLLQMALYQGLQPRRGPRGSHSAPGEDNSALGSGWLEICTRGNGI